ncbi:MAG: hypothetical protein ACRD2L_00845 [Terriglobia bacterium]
MTIDSCTDGYQDQEIDQRVGNFEQSRFLDRVENVAGKLAVEIDDDFVANVVCLIGDQTIKRRIVVDHEVVEADHQDQRGEL